MPGIDWNACWTCILKKGKSIIFSVNCAIEKDGVHSVMTVLTAKAADRTVFGILYVAVGLLTLWASFRMVDYGLEMRFINRYLRGWEIGISAYEAQQGTMAGV